MAIRKAKLKDISEIAELAVDLLEYHYTLDQYYAPVKDALDVYKKFFKQCIYSKNKYLLVAEEKGSIAGYALGEISNRPPVFKIKKIGNISDAYIKPEFQKRGIAKQFLKELYAWFKEHKLTYIELSVHVHNIAGMKAWSKYGFQNYLQKQRIDIAGLHV